MTREAKPRQVRKQLALKLEAELYDAFQTVCRNHKSNMRSVLLKYMEHVVQNQELEAAAPEILRLLQQIDKKVSRIATDERLRERGT